MDLDEYSQALRRAEELNAAAMKEAARGKLHKALEILNDAIRVAPDYSPSFRNRAEVFAGLGMHSQAAADRERAQQLPGVFPPPHPLTARPEKSQAAPTGRPTYSARESAPEQGLNLTAATRAGGDPWRLWLPLLAAISLAVIAVAGIGGVLAYRSLRGDDSSAAGSVNSPTATSPASASPSISGSAPGSDPPGQTGGAFTVAGIQRAWEAKGMTVTPSGASEGFSGLAVAPQELKATKGSDTMNAAVLVYRSIDQVREDWDLVSGQRPTLKAGRAVPSNRSIWWNQNIIVVVRSGTGAAYSDGLQAFLDLG